MKEKIEAIQHGLMLLKKKIAGVREISKEREVIKKLAKIEVELKEFSGGLHNYKIEELQLARNKTEGR